MRWLPAAVVAVAGCGTSTPKDCSVPAVMDDYLGSAVVDDCGNLQDDGVTGSDMAAWQAAQSCALDHAMQQHPFIVRWYAQGIEGPTLGAYAGTPRDGGWTLATAFQAAEPTGRLPPAHVDTCTGLQAISPCSEIHTNLCIVCNGPAIAEDCTP
jgi:hypothetical protein